MSDYGPDVITDVNGDPVGRYRDNQDPSDVTRLHPVPKTNAKGEVILDAGEPVLQMLPLDDPRTIAELAKPTDAHPTGLELAEDGITLVAIETPEEKAAREAAAVEEVPADA